MGEGIKLAVYKILPIKEFFCLFPNFTSFTFQYLYMQHYVSFVEMSIEAKNVTQWSHFFHYGKFWDKSTTTTTPPHTLANNKFSCF